MILVKNGKKIIRTLKAVLAPVALILRLDCEKAGLSVVLIKEYHW